MLTCKNIHLPLVRSLRFQRAAGTAWLAITLLACTTSTGGYDQPGPGRPDGETWTHPRSDPTAPVIAAPGAPALDPFAQALEKLLRQGTHPKMPPGHFGDSQLVMEQLYRSTGYKPLWTRDGKPTPQTRQMVASLAEAKQLGLKDEDYEEALLAEWVRSLENKSAVDEEELASFDTALSFVLIRYGKALHAGRIDPRAVNFSLAPRSIDYAMLVKRLAEEGNPSNILASLEPNLPIYRRLKIALAKYQVLAQAPSLSDVAINTTLNPRQRHKGVARLRQLLRALGDLPDDGLTPLDPDLYDMELVEAVKRFQKRHGLPANGVIGGETRVQLLMPLSLRVKQIELSLERLRWLPEPSNRPLLLINIPSFQLYGYQAGSDFESPDLRIEVIVGQAVGRWTTPVFYADMAHVIFRPYWNVPPSIARHEVIPSILRNPGYLRRNAMEIVDSYAPSARTYALNKTTIARLKGGSLKVRQRPGTHNALGRIKFVFPNEKGVYLHDTPSQQLFSRTRRDFSHGCIRVGDPVSLAEFVLGGNGGWTRERIIKAMNNPKSVTVNLPEPIPVYILYLTALADGSGTVYFYEDIYGHDKRLERALFSATP